MRGSPTCWSRLPAPVARPVGDVPTDSGAIDVLTTFYNARPATIYGGSNEIQRNILASAVLQLPG